MKILQITALYPPHIGGIENYVYRLSKKLVSNGHDVTIYTTNIPQSENIEVSEGICINRFESLSSPLNNQISPGLFYNLIKKNKFDVIHAHGYLQLTTNFALLSSLINNTPLVITCHGFVEYNDWKQLINLLYNKTVGKLTMSYADKVIALSSSQAEILHNMGVDNTIVIPNGVISKNSNDYENSTEFRRRFGLIDKTLLLFVGSLIPRKGVDSLIDAMENIQDNCVLMIIGDALPGTQGYKDKLYSMISEKNITNVIFTGHVDELTLKQAYQEADIFILPSLSEGLPTVLLEAMSYKKAIITTDIPGNNDLIINNENGLLVSPKNPIQITKALQNLIDNPNKRKEFGSKSFEKIATNYSWDIITDQIEEIYSSISKSGVN